MTRLFALLAGWKGYLAVSAVSALLAAGATYYVAAMGYRLTVAGLQRDQAQASARDSQIALAQFQDDAGRIHAAAERFSGLQARFDQQFDTLSKDFHSAIQNHPLPADCVPDAVRLRRLTDAVAAANAAAGGEPGAAVSPTP
jgi:hypothetical protein